MRVAGAIESYGTIRIDATSSAAGSAEIYLSAESEADRVIRLHRRASLLAYGSKSMPAGKRNVVIAAAETDGETGTAAIEAGEDNMLDLHYLHFRGVHVRASDIDNTGFQVHQRLNVLHSRFTDGARLTLQGCDTPAVKGNEFENDRPSRIDAWALRVQKCQLAQLRENTIRGYRGGVEVLDDVDSSLEGNMIRDCLQAVQWSGTNAMLKRNTIRNCETGVSITHSTGAVEELVAERVTGTAIHVAFSTMQLTSCHFVQPESKPSQQGVIRPWKPVALDRSSVTMLNCGLEPQQVNILNPTLSPRDNSHRVQAMEFLVVRVSGPSAGRRQVDVRTVGSRAPIGQGDANVRNSPAMLGTNGMTPLPGSHRSLIVKSFIIPAQGNVQSAPQYELTVYDPPEAASGDMTVKARQQIRPGPEWHRAEPDADLHTVEVKVP